MCMTGKNKIAEESFPLTDKYYREVYRLSPIGIELFDEKGKLIHANDACLQIFGVADLEEVRGFNLFDDPNLPQDARQRLQLGKIGK